MSIRAASEALANAVAAAARRAGAPCGATFWLVSPGESASILFDNSGLGAAVVTIPPASVLKLMIAAMIGMRRPDMFRALSATVRLSLMESDNMAAADLGAAAGGVRGLTEIVREYFRSNAEAIRLVDATGESEANRFPAHLAVALLADAASAGMFEHLLSHLPCYGVSGTLRHRTTPALARRVFAKTGTLHQSVALAGYVVPGEQSQIIVFALYQLIGRRGMQTPMPHEVARRAVDQIVEASLPALEDGEL